MAIPRHIGRGAGRNSRRASPPRHVAYSDPDNFGLSTATQVADQFKQITGAVALLTAVVSSIGLLVGGVGVMNIMLMSVRSARAKSESAKPLERDTATSSGSSSPRPSSSPAREESSACLWASSSACSSTNSCRGFPPPCAVGRPSGCSGFHECWLVSSDISGG